MGAGTCCSSERNHPPGKPVALNREVISAHILAFRIVTAAVAVFGLLCQAVLAAPPQPVYREASREGGQLKYVNGIPLLIVQGTPEQIGAQEIALVLEATRPLMAMPRKLLKEEGVEMLWPAVVALARSAMDRAPPRYRQELEAGDRGSKLSQAEQETLLVINSLAELRRFACSALIVEPARSASGEMLFGRNFDYASYGVLDRYGLVTVCRPKGLHAFAAVGFPGLLGVTSGMNDAGLAIACLDSGPAKDRSSGFLSQGPPLMLTFRRVLEECATVAEAQKLLQSVKHNTWMNLAACDRQRAVVFEITTRQVAVREAEAHLLAATNHFRTPALSVTKKCRRYEKLSKYWQRSGPLAWQDVAQAMRDVADREETIQTMIFEPATLRPRIARRAAGHRPAAGDAGVGEDVQAVGLRGRPAAVSSRSGKPTSPFAAVPGRSLTHAPRFRLAMIAANSSDELTSRPERFENSRPIFLARASS